MYFKLQLSDEENKELEQKAFETGLDKTAYIKKCLSLEASEKNIYNVEYALKLIKEKGVKGVPFTLYELYGEEWDGIKNGVAGVLGRNFYTYVATKGTKDTGIEYLGKKEVVIGDQARFQNQYVLKK